MSKIEVNTIETTSGSTLTIGKSGDTVTLASGASQSGFKSIEWQSVVTSDTTMVAGRGYFVNTTSGAITMTLPSSPSAGDTIAIKDYTGTFATNNCTIARGGSNLNGGANNYVADTAHLSLTLVYADSTEGWVAVNDNTTSVGPTFIQATGGTTSTSGNFKIHTFNSSSNFVVSSISNTAASNEVSYVVAAGYRR